MREYKDNLTQAAKKNIFKKASVLRKSMTETENILWKYLKNRQVAGMKFRRQHPLDIFIADFYCHEKKLIVELDGSIHDDLEQKEYDEGRTFELEEKGFTILRFRNEEIINEIERVIAKIEKSLK